MNVEELVSLLQTLESSNMPNNPDYILHSEDSDLVQHIEILASTTLIDDNGMNIYKYHEYLKSNGFLITPGERDRFGWLSGCIHTKKGIIIYG